jgi:hypothetical protein
VLRRPAAAVWRRAEWVAERRHHLLLAEHAYGGGSVGRIRWSPTRCRYRTRSRPLATSVSAIWAQ